MFTDLLLFTYMDRIKRDNAIYYMYTEVGYSMQEIAGIFKLSKARIHAILGDQINKRERSLKVAKKDL